MRAFLALLGFLQNPPTLLGLKHSSPALQGQLALQSWLSFLPRLTGFLSLTGLIGSHQKEKDPPVQTNPASHSPVSLQLQEAPPQDWAKLTKSSPRQMIMRALLRLS